MAAHRRGEHSHPRALCWCVPLPRPPPSRSSLFPSHLQCFFLQQDCPAFPGPMGVPSQPVRSGPGLTEHHCPAVTAPGSALLISPSPPPPPAPSFWLHCLRRLASPFPTGTKASQEQGTELLCGGSRRRGKLDGRGYLAGCPLEEVTLWRENSVTERRQPQEELGQCSGPGGAASAKALGQEPARQV